MIKLISQRADDCASEKQQSFDSKNCFFLLQEIQSRGPHDDSGSSLSLPSLVWGPENVTAPASGSVVGRFQEFGA